MNKKHRLFIHKLLAFVCAVSITVPCVIPHKAEAATATQKNGEELVNYILGNGITASNISYTGDVLQGANFSGADFLPFTDGIILSTGDASSVFQSADNFANGSFNGAGDNDLTGIYQSSGFTGVTHDAVSLQFTITPTSNKLSFRYIFASEEYDQQAQFNDVFALYVNGKNIALLPNGNTVSIQNTVNNDSYQLIILVVLT